MQKHLTAKPLTVSVENSMFDKVLNTYSVQFVQY